MKLVKPSFSIMAMSGHDELPYNYREPLALIEAAGRTCYKTEDKIGPGTAEKFVEMIQNNGHLSVMEHSWETRWYKFNNILIEALAEAGSLLSFSIYGNSIILSGNIRMFEDMHNVLCGFKYERDPIKMSQSKHYAATVRIICDRGVSHELVRHRMASYSQESTRYCNYSKKGDGNVAFIIPPWVDVKEGVYDDINLFENPKSEERRLYDQMEDSAKEWIQASILTEAFYRSRLKEGQPPQQARGKLSTDLKTEIVVTTNWAQWQHIFNMRSIGVAGKPHPQMLEIMQPLHAKFKEMEPEVFK